MPDVTIHPGGFSRSTSTSTALATASATAPGEPSDSPAGITREAAPQAWVSAHTAGGWYEITGPGETEKVQGVAAAAERLAELNSAD